MTRAWIPLAIAVLAPFGACKANLDESCEDGMCTGATVAAASSGTAGFTCTYGDTHGYPCDVYTIVHENCHRCHQDPPQNHAPFSLLTYDDTQPLYGGTPRWQHMKAAIEPGAIPGMPQGLNPPGLPVDQLNVLRAWFATCDAGTCARGQGLGGGGGAGGTSATTNSSSSTSGSSGTGSTGTGS